MTFRHEAEMQQPVRRWLERQGLQTKTEFATPWGICDLVGVAFNAENASRRLEHGQKRAIGPSSRVAILQAIPDEEADNCVTFDRLVRHFGPLMQPARLREELEHLQRSNFVTSPRKNSFQRLNGWWPLHERIVAVELKLARVLEAAGQAYSHQAFASEAFVALPEPVAERVVADPRGEQLRQMGLGILSVGAVDCAVLLASGGRPDLLDPTLQLACVERFWKHYLTSSSSSAAELRVQAV